MIQESAMEYLAVQIWDNSQQILKPSTDGKKNNNMEFNSDKFEHVHYKANNSEEPIQFKQWSPIETKSRVRDLGITMSSNASFTNHISERITALK